jgi:hypothetical protein
MNMKKNCFLGVFLFITFIASQVFAQSISGTISFASSQPSTGHLLLEYALATGPGPSCSAADWWNNRTEVDKGVVSFPYAYNVSLPASGTYCIGAYVDNPPTGTPPDLTDPAGIYSLNPGEFTPVTTDASGIDITLDDSDAGNLTGYWNYTVAVDITGVGSSVDCVYAGSLGLYHIYQNSLAFGGGPILSSTGTLCPPFIDMFFFCDVSTNPINCSIVGPPSIPSGSPYTSQGTISNNGDTITGSLQGSANMAGIGQVTYSAQWTLNKLLSSIPTFTQWGMIIFLVLAGLGALYYLRRQKNKIR